MTDHSQQHDQGETPTETCPSTNCAEECDHACMARERNVLNDMCANEAAHGGHVWYDGRQRPRECPGYVGRSGVPRGQGETVRAAQVAAARAFLDRYAAVPARLIADVAAAFVDAVLAAGGLCGHTTDSLLLNHPPLVCTMPAGHAGLRHGDDNSTRWTPHGDAVANLRDGERYDAWVAAQPYDEDLANDEPSKGRPDPNCPTCGGGRG